MVDIIVTDTTPILGSQSRRFLLFDTLDGKVPLGGRKADFAYGAEGERLKQS